MIIYPSVDLLDQKCVRLQKGEYDKVTVYSDDPAMFAKKWQKAGAKFLHVVDLNGARTGDQINLHIIRDMVKHADMPIQVGGGIRSIETIQCLLDEGVKRVILGTGAVKNPDLIKKAVQMFGEAIVVGIDAKDGYVAIDGWETKSEFTAIDFAKKMQSIGVKTIIYTDIARDGMLKGPNLAAMKQMKDNVTMDVIASGGVGQKKDVDDLYQTGVDGVIIGKALYEGLIDLKEVVDAYETNHTLSGRI